MNKAFITTFLLCVSLAAAGQGGFREEYAKYDTLPDIGRLVCRGAVTPEWLGNDTFVFETREAGGMKYYEVSVPARTKTLSEKKSQPEKAGVQADVAEDPAVSPDGKWRAVIKDSNVWLEGEDKQQFQLSFDGTDGDAYKSVYWSPDSRKLAALRVRKADVRRIPLLESSPQSQLQPVLQWRDYPKPGDVLPTNRFTLFDVVSRAQVNVDMMPFENHFNLPFGQWMADSRSFTFEFNRRGHQVYQLVSVDAATGKTFIFVDEQSPTFINHRYLYRYFMEEGKSVIWASERDGWRHFYLIDCKTGKVKKQLTKGEWVVRDVIRVDEKAGYMIFTGNGRNAASGEDPYNIHYYRLNLANGALTDLTPENGNHKAYFSPDFANLVDTWSRPDMPAVSVVRSAESGKLVMEIQKADISRLLELGFTMPEPFHAKGRDGRTDIWGTIFRPFDFDPSKKYPIVELIYAGPHDSHVPKNFFAYSRESKLMEMGFIVVRIDGMGTANRSKAFHDIAWRNLKDAGFPDRILWMKAAGERYPYMDLDRVGVYGYSAGGQNAMGALLWHNDFYKAAVALCGCHDNRMDKMSWNECWMGYPVGPWYAENSNAGNARLLEGSLLIINGELDDNVDPASSLQVVDALIKADKDFEQLYLPSFGHGMVDEYVTRKIYEFLVKNLRDRID